MEIIELFMINIVGLVLVSVSSGFGPLGRTVCIELRSLFNFVQFTGNSRGSQRAS